MSFVCLMLLVMKMNEMGMQFHSFCYVLLMTTQMKAEIESKSIEKHKNKTQKKCIKMFRITKEMSEKSYRKKERKAKIQSSTSPKKNQ